jgi:hypothetical protein
MIEWRGSNLVTLVEQGLDEYETLLLLTMQAILKAHQADAERWMKDNAPWTDRTANARQSLWADVQRMEGQVGYELVLSHGVDYGFWLEVLQEGKYGIVLPAHDKYKADIIRAIQEIFA